MLNQTRSNTYISEDRTGEIEPWFGGATRSHPSDEPFIPGATKVSYNFFEYMPDKLRFVQEHGSIALDYFS